MKRLIVSTAVIVGLAGASAASAGEVTRSASVLPSIQSSKAPLNARRSVAMKKKSRLQEEAAAGAGAGGVSSTALVIGGLGGLAVVGGIVAATESNDNDSGS